jgi:transposase InsO family protein
MWQGNTFQVCIRGVGKVYLTGFTDDCSRYRVRSKVYIHKDAASSVNALHWALRAGRIPCEIYIHNRKQFVFILFKAESQRHNIKPIFGRPYNPRIRGKIKRYHKTLTRNSLKTLVHVRFYTEIFWEKRIYSSFM